MADVVAIGEILVEIMATRVGQTFREPGLFAGPYPSGAPAVFADQAARVGASTAMVGCVGQDDFGTLNIERLARSGADVRAIRHIPGATTGIAFVTYREDGGRDFAFTVEEVDPTGAGDCFGGTFVACLTLGVPVRRALHLANAAGALAVGRKGPMEGNSTMAELEAFLAERGVG